MDRRVSKKTLLHTRRSANVGENRIAYLRLDTAGVTGPIQSARVRSCT